MPSPNPKQATVSGTSVTLDTAIPTRSGYTFLGWNTNSSATTATYTAANVSAGLATLTLDPETANTVTLYAIWSRTYTLNYDANNGTGAPSPDTGSSATGSYTFTVSNTEPTRDSYTFLGWATSSSATEAEYEGGDSFTTTTTPRTLYAVWQQSATSMIGFDCSTLTSVGATATVYDPRDNSTYTVTKLADNKCWMTSNLRLSFANLQQDITLYNTNNPTSAFITAANAKPASNAASEFSSSNYDVLKYNTANFGVTTTDSDGHTYDEYGAYYNWHTATAGNGMQATPTGTNITGDICPRGWHLPTGHLTSGSVNGEFGILSNALGGYKNGSNIAQNMTSSTTPKGADMSAILRNSTNNFMYSGYVYSGSIYSRGSYGYYWSSTSHTSYASSAFILRFGSSSVYPGTGYSSKYYGYAVRCVAGTDYALSFNANGGSNAPATQYVNIASSGVSSVTFNLTSSAPTRDDYTFLGWSTNQNASSADYQPGDTFTTSNSTNTLYAVWGSSGGSGDSMTAFSCSELSNVGDSTTLTDPRDGTEYTVALLDDGNCWMTENLKLDLATATITAQNTNNPTASFLNEVSSASSTTSWCTDYNSECFDQILYNTDDADDYGGYYNWYTATAGNGTYSFDTNGDSTSGDLCPAGWHLPTQTEFAALSSALGDDASTFLDSPNNFALSGYFDPDVGVAVDQGDYGGWWSSAAYGEYVAFNLTLDEDIVVPGGGYDKFNGLSLRCLAPAE